MQGQENRSRKPGAPPLRWGFVGTGSIASWMADCVGRLGSAELVAVASRSRESAGAFAERFGAKLAFDDWATLCAADDVDAVYIATPTALREEIGIAAARAGKHVLGEKPFASCDSLGRITAACREAGVAFMDATHFVHHPRTAAIRARLAGDFGWPATVDSAFLIDLPDRGDIRYDPALEPMGAIGDLGWYSVRAALEYRPPDATAHAVDARLRRDPASGAAIAGAGVLEFDDGSTSTWTCGFDTGAAVIELRLAGPAGVIRVDDFLGQDEDGSAAYRLHERGEAGTTVRVASDLPGPALMFDDFAAAVREPSLREHWMTASERTQRLLDAVWAAASG